jgi:hypothetical protein
MAIIFLTMAVVNFPSMMVFLSGNLSTGVTNVESIISKVSLGNIGEVNAACDT